MHNSLSAALAETSYNVRLVDSDVPFSSTSGVYFSGQPELQQRGEDQSLINPDMPTVTKHLMSGGGSKQTSPAKKTPSKTPPKQTRKSKSKQTAPRKTAKSKKKATSAKTTSKKKQKGTQKKKKTPNGKNKSKSTKKTNNKSSTKKTNNKSSKSKASSSKTKSKKK